MSYADSRANKMKIDWADYEPVKPEFTGVKIIEPELQEIASYIDWQPFFIAWEMHGKFPQLLTDEIIGEAASRLYADAQALLKKIIEEKWLVPRGVIGIWPANATGDDTVTIDITPCPFPWNSCGSNLKKQQAKRIYPWQILLCRPVRVKPIISVLFP